MILASTVKAHFSPPSAKLSALSPSRLISEEPSPAIDEAPDAASVQASKCVLTEDSRMITLQVATHSPGTEYAEDHRVDNGDIKISSDTIKLCYHEGVYYLVENNEYIPLQQSRKVLTPTHGIKITAVAENNDEINMADFFIDDYETFLPAEATERTEAIAFASVLPDKDRLQHLLSSRVSLDAENLNKTKTAELEYCSLANSQDVIHQEQQKSLLTTIKKWFGDRRIDE